MANSIAHASVGTALTQAEYESVTGSHVWSIEHHTADDTLTVNETGSIHTNLGEDGAMTLTLPQASATGCVFFFVVMTAQELRIDPGAAGAIYINGAKQADDAYITANDEGESVMLIGDGNGDWISLFTVGIWTVV